MMTSSLRCHVDIVFNNYRDSLLYIFFFFLYRTRGFHIWSRAKAVVNLVLTWQWFHDLFGIMNLFWFWSHFVIVNNFGFADHLGIANYCGFANFLVSRTTGLRELFVLENLFLNNLVSRTLLFCEIFLVLLLFWLCASFYLQVDTNSFFQLQISF